MNRRTLGLIFLVALTSAAGVVHAQGPSGGLSARASKLGAERQRLRTELDRLNTEIDALKRDNRGIRDDYRLRSRMADAEALARRLTEIDARAPGAPTSTAGQRDPAMSFPSAPEAEPSDDRAVLEAKADILADQARRLTTQADVLAGRVTDLRGRNELRRRAGQLERDPFSPLEQAKRRLTTSGSTLAAGTGSSFGNNAVGTSKGVGTQSAEGTRDTVAGGPTITASPGMTAPGAAPPPPSGGTGNFGAVATTAPVAAPGGAASAPGGATTLVPQTPPPSAMAGSVSKAQPSLLPPPTLPPPTPDTAGSVAIQFRGILDASTLAEIRRLESAGSPAGNLAAMEWALSALRARAAQLSTNAATLRNSARAVR